MINTYPLDRPIATRQDAVILPIGKVSLKTGKNEMFTNVLQDFAGSGVVLYKSVRYHGGDKIDSYYMVFGSIGKDGDAKSYLAYEGGMLIHDQTRQKLGYSSRIILTGPLTLETFQKVKELVGKSNVNTAVYK